MDMPTRTTVLLYLIQHGPGRTEIELARAIYGEGATQQQVNQVCSLLESRGLVERRGAGGQSEPYRYYPHTVQINA